MPDSQHTHTEAVLQSHNANGFNRDIRHVDEQTTMSSREIAELTGKRHDNVMRDARDMLIELHGKGGLLKFEGTYLNEQNGQRYPLYDLPKRESLILVSGYNLTMRAKIIDRWQELEAQASDPARLLTDPTAMRGLLLVYAEKQIEMQGEIEEMRPQVQALERIAASDGSLCITDAAKTLQVQPKALFQFLDSHHWTYTRQGDNTRIAYPHRRATPPSRRAAPSASSPVRCPATPTSRPARARTRRTRAGHLACGNADRPARIGRHGTAVPGDSARCEPLPRSPAAPRGSVRPRSSPTRECPAA